MKKVMALTLAGVMLAACGQEQDNREMHKMEKKAPQKDAVSNKERKDAQDAYDKRLEGVKIDEGMQKLYNERERVASKLKVLEERAPKYVKVLDVKGSRARVISTMGAPVEETVTLGKGVKVKEGDEVIIQQDGNSVRVLKTEKLIQKAESETIKLKKRYSELDAQFRKKYDDITPEQMEKLAREAKKTLKEEK